MELSKPADLPDYPYPQEQIFESQFWMQTQGWIEARTTYQFLVDRSIVQYSPMGIVILYNRVYECIQHMYTTYTNNFDTSHVAYPEHMTTEEQQAEWAVFAALQPPQADSSHLPSNTRRASTPTALHTYPVSYIPSYIFPASTSTSPHTSAPTSSPSTILPTHIASPSHASKLTQESAQDFLQQMLNPLVSNFEAAPPPEGLDQQDIPEMPTADEEEEAPQPPPPPPPKEWTESVYTFQDLQTQAHLCNWTGALQKQGLRLIDIMDVRTLTRFIRKSMWCWADSTLR